MTRTLETGEVQTRTFPVGDWGQRGRFEARFVRASDDEVLCIVRDVTEQVRTEDALRASEERYRTVVEALAEGILIHDPTGAVYACNRSATLILGVRETDLLGSDTGLPNIRWVLPNDEPLPATELPAQVTVRTGQPTVDQVLGIDREGNRPVVAGQRPSAHRVGRRPPPRRHLVRRHHLRAQSGAGPGRPGWSSRRWWRPSSTRLIDCPPDLVDQTVTAALGEVARFFDADVGFIDELGADRSTLRLTHEWRRPGLSASSAESDSVPVNNVDWTLRQFERQPYIFVRSIDDLPEEAEAERATLLDGRNLAFLWVRLGGGVDLAGITGIVWKHRMPAAAEEQILSLVRLAGEAFLGALRRRSVGLLASGQARVFVIARRRVARR